MIEYPCLSFPKEFVFGAATAAYQIEGAASADGRGESVWDMMCRRPRRIYEGQTGEIACDHYHRFSQDISLMREIGLEAYRLSISWPRIIPDGTGAVNGKGVDFYDRLIDELLRAGIEPWVTLYHWDLPYELYCRGGWLNRESPRWFAEYTQTVVDRLSDRVGNWITLNEPQCFIGLGLESGKHAPGDQLGLREVLRAGHHTLLAHGSAVQVIRSYAKRAPIIGWAPVGVAAIPVNPNDPHDVEAARQAMFYAGHNNPIVNPWDTCAVWNNTWWADPVVFGKYPEDAWEAFGDSVPKIGSGDMEIISQPIDFYGANIYNGAFITRDAAGRPKKQARSDGFPITAMKWGVTEQCLYWATKFLYERYKLPVVVTENGMSNADWKSTDGRVHDPQRIDFLYRYLGELCRAIHDGVDVRGYFHWTVMDNFEWIEGFKERLGLIHVDFETQERTLKESAFWYRDLIKRRTLSGLGG